MTYNNNMNKDPLLPPAELLAKYKDLGLGENLVELVREEQKHRHELQKKYLINYRLGQIFGFIIILFFLKSVFDLVRYDYKIEAYILSSILSISTLIIIMVLRFNNKVGLKNRIAAKKRFNNNNSKLKTYQRKYNKR